MSYQVNEKRKTYDIIETIREKDLENTIADWNGRGFTVEKSELIDGGFTLYGKTSSFFKTNYRPRGITNYTLEIPKKSNFKTFISSFFRTTRA